MTDDDVWCRYLLQVETASYDPIFWFHHTFVDCAYEWFRKNQVEKKINPMRDWPAEYGDPAHSPFAAMRLGRLRMIDGANNFFTERIIRCLDPPSTCSSNQDCGAHMRCNTINKRCISDTLGVGASAPGSPSDLRSSVGLSSINNLLNGIPARGFNQLFQVPGLDFLTATDSFGSRFSGLPEAGNRVNAG